MELKKGKQIIKATVKKEVGHILHISELAIDFNFTELAGEIVLNAKAMEFLEQHGPEVVIVPSMAGDKILSWHLLPKFRFDGYLKNRKSGGKNGHTNQSKENA